MQTLLCLSRFPKKPHSLPERPLLLSFALKITRSKIVEEEIADKTQPQKDDGSYPTVKKWTRRREEIGGYNHIMLISPYDFICDPGLPLYRMQEMRFMGHRSRVPWIELKKRAELDPSDPQYVSPRAVEELKKHKPGATLGSSVSTGTGGTGGPGAGQPD